MKRLFILLAISLFFISNMPAQEYYELEELFLDADSWFSYEDYEEAIPLFLRVLESDSLNYNVMYKIGFSYLQIPGQKAKSIPYLENAIQKTTDSYRNNTYSEKLAPVDALFYLGNAYLVNNKIDEAIDVYSGFQNAITRTKKLANKDIYNTDYLDRQFNACRNALQFQYEPVSFIASNLGNPINTRFNEFNAIVSGDGSTLVFTASLQFYDAIFYSKKDSNGKWGYPINIMGQLGIDDKSASTGLSYDGTELYIYRDDNFDGNIYVSYLKNGMWTEVKKLDENINTKYWESHASLSPDNQKLYFVSNRAGGFGDLDIYVAQRLPDSTWSVPENLGENINTRWNENTPFLTPDGNRLFFSSEGHKGMGGYDIFYSEKAGNTWSTPVNIGYPINSTDNDIFFAPNENGSFAYCSQFSRKGFGGQDIYQFQLLDLPGYNNLIVEGIETFDNKQDRNKKDFSINIINKTNQDTIAILKPDNDVTEYQYQTPLGLNHLVYESLKNDETGDQFYISKSYDIKEVFLSTLIPDETIEEDILPEINAEKSFYTADSDDRNIKIKLSVQKGNKLFVNTFYKDDLINSEEFDINKEDFIYEYKPLIGESIIKFKLVDKNNNVKTEEVTVSYLPKDFIAELNIDEKIVTLSENGKKSVKIKLSVEKGSKLFVETYVDDQLINKESFNINKESFVYELEPKGEKSKLNFKLVDKHNNVKNEEIIISHTPINEDLASILSDVSSFNNKDFRTLIGMNKITSATSAEDLISQIYAKAESMGLSKEQTQALIIALAISSTDNTEEFINKLYQISDGDLNVVLKEMNLNQADYKNNLSAIQNLEKESEIHNYNNNDIINLLEKYLYTSGIPVDVLLAKLQEILKSDISGLLENMDASAIDIVSIEDLKTYLRNKNTYSETELNNIFALLEGMNIASKAAKEAELAAKEEKIPTKYADTKANKWMILYISIAGILLGIIIIYFNRRKDKANKESRR
ncbi:MAG: PD40 domain-containing protein [Bacteroidales bacterium]|nr:PD40 domain-containing protein [Bacteroidales bacterium]